MAAGADSEVVAEEVRLLVVWDYDWSLIDTNSDTYVVEQLRPQLYSRFELDGRPGGPKGWTATMDYQMEGLWELGVTPDDLKGCVAAVPVSDGCLQAVRLAADHSPGVQQMILSDANSVFIEAFLEGRGLRSCMREVVTNPAEFDAEGRLHVSPYHTGPRHTCPLCPSNLCKGMVLERVRAALSPDCVVYVGDGGGDFCPACDLRPGDAVLCRAPPSPPLEHFGLHRRINRSLSEAEPKMMTRHGRPATINADVLYWHTGADLARHLTQLLLAKRLATSELGEDVADTACSL